MSRQERHPLLFDNGTRDARPDATSCSSCRHGSGIEGHRFTYTQPLASSLHVSHKHENSPAWQPGTSQHVTGLDSQLLPCASVLFLSRSGQGPEIPLCETGCSEVAGSPAGNTFSTSKAGASPKHPPQKQSTNYFFNHDCSCSKRAKVPATAAQNAHWKPQSPRGKETLVCLQPSQQGSALLLD